MTLAVRRGPSSYDARMLAAADRLFGEFDELPVLSVIRAFARARSEVRERDGVASPEVVEVSARRLLRNRATADLPS